MREWAKKHAVEIAAAMATLATVALILLGLYEALCATADRTGPSYGEIVRNYGLVIAAIWAAVLAVWRSRIAERQVDEQRKAVDEQRKAVDEQRKAVEAQRDATTQSDEQHRRSLSQTRLFQAVKLLKDKDETVKNAGARTLGRLVHDEDNPYRGGALRMLEEFIRSHGSIVETDAAKTQTEAKVAPLVHIAVRTVAEKELPDGLMFDLHKINLAYAALAHAHLSRADLSRADLSLSRADLSRADLTDAKLIRADLTDADLTDAKLTDAKLTHADLTYAKLIRAHLFGADLIRADLSRADLMDAKLPAAKLGAADLTGADLTGADFWGAKRLTQEQLDAASQRPYGPPPRNLPDGLTWDEEAAKKRWQERHGR